MRLYIDPGTGSMLFTILLGVIGAAFYSFRMLLMKLRFKLTGGKVEKNTQKTPLVIFSDDARYWTVYAPVCRELDKFGIPVVYLTASEKDPGLQCTYENVKTEYIGGGNRAFTKLNYLNASIVLSTTPGLDVYQWKRSKDVQYYVHIPHAASEITMYRMFGIDHYDAILLSGEYQVENVRTLERIRNLPPKELVKIGIPYMDEMAARLKKEGPAPEHSRTILLAPSWGNNAIFGVYGSKIIDVLLQTGYHVIIRPHPQSFISEKEMIDKMMHQYPETERLEWNRDADNFEVLRRSDILISDFSGVIFDFTLVYDKPIIYTNPNFDLSMYDAWWMKEPVWTVSALPRLGRELTSENMDNLKDLIDECLLDPKYAQGRKEVKKETWEYTGDGASRAAEYLRNKLEELTGIEEGA